MSERRPRVLMVTGAYAPEISGASLQCRALIRAIGPQAAFTVLTTSTDRGLPWQSRIDGTEVRRIAVNPASRIDTLVAAERMASSILELAGGIDLVHLHGFSRKSRLVIAMARFLGKPVIIKLTSLGHDDPAAILAKGMWAMRAFRKADRFIGVTPRFVDGFEAHGLEPRRFVFIPNGVDLERFRPALGAERAEVRTELGLPVDQPVILFVGFFSREKNPNVAFGAWADLAARGVSSTLVLVGATSGAYYEIDPSMAASIREEAARRGLADRLVFVESTDAIEQYYRAADVFVLPSAREGLPNVLLEAMACGVAPVVTRLDGVTDWIVDPGVSGELVASVERGAFASALEPLLRSPERRRALGAMARRHVEAHFDIRRTAQRTLDVYHDLLAASRGGRDQAGALSRGPRNAGPPAAG